MVWLGKASSPQTNPLLWSLGVATPSTLDLMSCPNLDSFNAVPLSFPTLTTDPQTSCFHRKYDDRIHILPHPENSSESRHQKVYSCGQAQHLPSIWKLHFLCLGWVMGLRSCLRGEGSCSYLGLLGAALLGRGLLPLAEVNTCIGVEVLVAPACPTPVATPNLRNSGSTG